MEQTRDGDFVEKTFCDYNFKEPHLLLTWKQDMKLLITLAAISRVERSVLAQRPVRNVEQIVIKPTAQVDQFILARIRVLFVASCIIEKQCNS